MDELRKEFEAELRKSERYVMAADKPHVLARNEDGQYVLWTVEAAWQGFLMGHSIAMRLAAAAVESLRDGHCASTKLSPDKDDWCEPGGIACDLVAAWNDAIKAIRKLDVAKEQS